jgi:hypothetical protein
LRLTVSKSTTISARIAPITINHVVNETFIDYTYFVKGAMEPRSPSTT